jgi:hypothetical protein
VQSGQSIPVTVTVRNDGNLTDVTEVGLYEGSQLGSWSFEVEPGETKTHIFQAELTHSGQLTLVAGTQVVTRTIRIRQK